MRNFDLNISNADGSPYWTESFDSKKDLNLWLNEEQTRPYWQKSFVVKIVDNTAAIAERDAAAKAAEDQAQANVAAARQALKDLRQKKNKTLPDAVALLEKIVDYLGIT